MKSDERPARTMSREFKDALLIAVPTPSNDAEAYRGASLWCADHSAKGS
jgi:hypothetical protein